MRRNDCPRWAGICKRCLASLCRPLCRHMGGRIARESSGPETTGFREAREGGSVAIGGRLNVAGWKKYAPFRHRFSRWAECERMTERMTSLDERSSSTGVSNFDQTHRFSCAKLSQLLGKIRLFGTEHASGIGGRKMPPTNREDLTTKERPGFGHKRPKTPMPMRHAETPRAIRIRYSAF
jgi:hypothetical protein